MPSVKDYLYNEGRKRGFVVNPPHVAGMESVNTEQGSKINDSGSAVVDETGFSIDITHGASIDQDGPTKQIIRKNTTKIQRRIRAIIELNERVNYLVWRAIMTVWNNRPWREKTEIEKEREAEIKARKKMTHILRKESKLFMNRASNTYARMGMCYVPPLHARSMFNGIKKIRFMNVVADPNAIWLQIATDRLPWGVDILQIIHDEGILTNLSASLRHHVQGYYDVEKGAWLCIERGRGVRGIPQTVLYGKMINLIPEKAHRLTIPFGETVNSRRIYKSLREFPHLLIAGSTGQGKTCYLNVILACLIHNNTPNDLKIVLVDLKNGIEFDMYKEVPHLWKMGGKGKNKKEEIAPEGIVGRPEKVILLLERMIIEGERRLNLFRRLKVTNIDEYNRGRTKSRMSRILMVIDEWARVALSPDGKRADTILSEITATYRAVGFHVILATQMPIARVVSTLIKTNFSGRLAFGVPDINSSMVILGSGRAKGLEPVGRAILQHGTKIIETQVPYITKSELLAVLDESRADGGRVEDEVGMLEIFQYSLVKLDGSLSVRPLYKKFQDRIAYNALADKLKTMDGLFVDVDGIEYEVIPGDGGANPRRLEKYIKETPLLVPNDPITT